MIPYAVLIGDITPGDLALLDQATAFVADLNNPPNQPPDQPLSCHDVCAAWVLQGRPGTHTKGTWAGAFDHSWIVLPSGVILDLYPVASTRPSLFARIPFCNPYKPKETP